MQIDLEALKLPCSCGKAHRVDVKSLLIESGAIRKLSQIVIECGLEGKRALIVCDQNTLPYARQAKEQLPDAELATLSGTHIHADEHAVRQVEDAFGQGEYGYLIAVGSGTVHDTTRYVAFQRQISFISCPTAASVDGFVSTVAAMTWGGFKVTFEAVSPVAVVADSDIFSKAPYRLTASGVSDLLGKYTSLADWEISHLVTGEYYCPRVAALMQEALDLVVKNLDAVRACEKEACEQLMYALILSGLAMQMVGNSRPASGAEHHMSHLWEMEVLNPALDALHGEKVGVALAYVCGQYHQIAEIGDIEDHMVGRYSGIPEEKLWCIFGKLYDAVLKENTPDPLTEVKISQFTNVFPQIQEVVERIPTESQVRDLLVRAGAKAALAEIGLGENVLKESLELSPYVRRRMTLMRLRKLIRLDG